VLPRTPADGAGRYLRLGLDRRSVWKSEGSRRREADPAGHFTTSNRKWVAPGVSIELVLRSSIPSGSRSSKSRMPSPRSLGMRWSYISSSNPAFRYCLMMFAPPQIPTSLSPAAARASSSAASSPSVTNV
jgi:hypothetical protein